MHRHKLFSSYTANLLAFLNGLKLLFKKMKEKVKGQKNVWMKTKSNKVNMIKQTYLLIRLSNMAIYGE